MKRHLPRSAASKSEHMRPSLLRSTGALLLTGFALISLADSHFVRVAAADQDPAPHAKDKDPETLAAHDTHQRFLVAADPWLNEEDYKSRFGKKNPYTSGFVAIDAYFRNDSDK